jgi:K+ transporter
LLQHQGQVYIPFINYLLMTLCLIIVGTFQTSTNIGKAYGKSTALLPCTMQNAVQSGLCWWGRMYSLLRPVSVNHQIQLWQRPHLCSLSLFHESS